MDTMTITQLAQQCPVCKAPMRADHQREAGYQIYACENPDCRLYGHTFGEPDCSEVDFQIRPSLLWMLPPMPIVEEDDTAPFNLVDALPMSQLRTGDVYLDHMGYEVTVIRRDGDHAFVQEEASDWVIEAEMDEEAVVTVVRRDSFCLLEWAVDYIDNRRWRACIGE
jgi:hypothetical protein